MAFFSSRSPNPAVAGVTDRLENLQVEQAGVGRALEDLVREAAPEPGWSTPAPTPPPEKRRLPQRLATLRRELREKVLASVDEADGWSRDDQTRITELRKRLDERLAGVQLTAEERAMLEEALWDDVLGFGAIQSMVADRTVSEIMVNGPDVIFIEQGGKLVETEHVFDDEAHLQWTAQRIVRPLQRHLDRGTPLVDARLPDGSRVHCVIPPAAVNGTAITIRKFPAQPLTVDDLVRKGSVTEEIARLLEMCVVARLNIVVAGGTGSGKTTFLNVLSAYIPESERIVTIEDAAELQLTQRHVVPLETTPPIPGAVGRTGHLQIRDLVCGSLRMRPDRIVVGECRGGEALDMLQAMNTGHDGSLTTIHANSPRDTLSRLETLCLMAGVDLPLVVIRRQMASAINLIVQLSRLKDGSRRVVQVSEVDGIEGETITMQDLFVYRAAGHKGPGFSVAPNGRLEATGMRPHFIARLQDYGLKIDPALFNSR